MLADGKAPPASSYYGIIGKSESRSLQLGLARAREASRGLARVAVGNIFSKQSLRRSFLRPFLRRLITADRTMTDRRRIGRTDGEDTPGVLRGEKARKRRESGVIKIPSGAESLKRGRNRRRRSRERTNR